MSGTPTDPALIAAIITAFGGLVSIAGWIAKRHISLIDSMESRIETDRKERIDLLRQEKEAATVRATKEAERTKHEMDEARTRAEFQNALIAAQREQTNELNRIASTLRGMQAGHERLATAHERVTNALELESDRIDVLTEALEGVVGSDVMDRVRSRFRRQSRESLPPAIMADALESPLAPPPPMRRRQDSGSDRRLSDVPIRRG